MVDVIYTNLHYGSEILNKSNFRYVGGLSIELSIKVDKISFYELSNYAVKYGKYKNGSDSEDADYVVGKDKLVESESETEGSKVKEYVLTRSVALTDKVIGSESDTNDEEWQDLVEAIDKVNKVEDFHKKGEGYNSYEESNADINSPGESEDDDIREKKYNLDVPIVTEHTDWSRWSYVVSTTFSIRYAFKEVVRRPYLPAKEIQTAVKEKFKVIIGKRFAYKEKSSAHTKHHGSMKENYGKIGSYLKILRHENPSSTFELVTVPSTFHGIDSNNEVFKNLSIGRDATEKKYTLDWAVVKGGNDDSWGWFMHELYKCLENLFQVKDLDDVSVDIDKRSCTCRKWDLTSIPCYHAYALLGFLNKPAKYFMHGFYSKEMYMKSYQFSIPPLPNEKYWPAVDFPLDPLIIKVIPGRPNKNGMRDPHEDPNKPGRLTEHGINVDT
ncbi:hypothetical protein SSX86_002409 [Deinandra increscens subsp. villosa]|uniref:SWIM-type domain-containing protein n=1 Tax=Deinandra increscens subsp. villosa TaxID=3103831 RepID=A0AAP0DSS8_9ASTR